MAISWLNPEAKPKRITWLDDGSTPDFSNVQATTSTGRIGDVSQNSEVPRLGYIPSEDDVQSPPVRESLFNRATGSLSRMAQPLVSGITAPVIAGASTVPAQARSVAGGAQRAYAELTPGWMFPMSSNEEVESIRQTVGDAGAERYARSQQEIAAIKEEAIAKGADPFMLDAAISAPTTAAMLGGSMVNPALGLGLLTGITGPQSYAGFRAEGLSPSEAAQAAVAETAAEVVPSVVPAAAIARSARLGRAPAAVAVAAAEAGQEGTTDILQQANRVVLGLQDSIDLEQSGRAAGLGAVLGAPFGAAAGRRVPTVQTGIPVADAAAQATADIQAAAGVNVERTGDSQEPVTATTPTTPTGSTETAVQSATDRPTGIVPRSEKIRARLNLETGQLETEGGLPVNAPSAADFERAEMATGINLSNNRQQERARQRGIDVDGLLNNTVTPQATTVADSATPTVLQNAMPLAETAAVEAPASQSAAQPEIEEGIPEPVFQEQLQALRSRVTAPEVVAPAIDEMAIRGGTSPSTLSYYTTPEEIPSEFRNTTPVSERQAPVINAIKTATNAREAVDALRPLIQSKPLQDFADKIGRYIDLAEIPVITVNPEDAGRTDLGPANYLTAKGKERTVGAYSPATREIYLKGEGWKDNGMNPEALLHELQHAASVHVYDAVKRGTVTDENAIKAVADIEALASEFNANSDAFASFPKETRDRLRYAATNPKEFMAITQTSPLVQQALKKEGLWKRFVNAIRNMFGYSRSELPLLERILTAGDAVMGAQQQAQLATAPPAAGTVVNEADYAPGDLTFDEMAVESPTRASQLFGPEDNFSPISERVRKYTRLAEELIVPGRVSFTRNAAQRGAMRDARDIMERSKGTKLNSNQIGHSHRLRLQRDMKADNAESAVVRQAMATRDFSKLPEKTAKSAKRFRMESDEMRYGIVEEILYYKPYNTMTAAEKGVINKIVSNDDYFTRVYSMDIDPQYANRILDREVRGKANEVDKQIIEDVIRDVESIVMIPADLRVRHLKYNFPAQVYKKDGTVTKLMQKWMDETGATIVSPDYVSLDGKRYKIREGEALTDQALNKNRLKQLFEARVGPSDGLSSENMVSQLEQIRASQEAVAYDDTVKGIVRELANPKAEESTIGRYFRGGRADLGITNPRENVPESFRRFWGEVDPNKQLPLASAITIQKQNSLLEQLRLLRFAEARGREKGWLSDVSKTGYTELRGDSFGALKGKFVPDNVAEMLEQQLIASRSAVDLLDSLLTDDPNFYSTAFLGTGAKVVRGLAGAVKANQVLGNLASWALNGPGNIAVLATNGNLPLLNGTLGVQGAKRGFGAVFDSVGASFKAGENPYTQELIKNNLLQSPTVSDINSALRKEVVRDIMSNSNSVTEVLQNSWDAVRRWGLTLGEAYAVLDLWATGTGYYKNKDDLQAHWDKIGKEYTPQDLEFEAARLTRSTNFNWSMTPKIVQAVEKTGATQFAVYFFETYRVMASNLIIGAQQIAEGTRTGDARYAAHGAARIAGVTLATQLSPITAGILGAVGATILGAGDEEDELQADAVVANNDFVNQPYLVQVQEKPDGTKLYFDINRADALDPVNNSVYAALNGEDIGASIGELLFANTFWTRALSVAKDDPTQMKSRLRSQAPEAFADKTQGNWYKAAAQSLGEVLLPGFLTNRAIANAKEEAQGENFTTLQNIAQRSGLYLTEYHPLNSIGTNKGYAARFNRNTQEAWRTLGNFIGQPRSVSEDEMKAQYASYLAEETRAKLDISLAIDAAKQAGYSTGEIASKLQEGGISKAASRVLARDPERYHREVSRQFLQQRQKARIEDDRNNADAITKEFNEKRRMFQRITREMQKDGS